MSFAFKEELNELVIFCRCCSAANLWVLTLSHLSIIEGADILHEPRGTNIGGLETLGPHKVGATDHRNKCEAVVFFWAVLITKTRMKTVQCGWRQFVDFTSKNRTFWNESWLYFSRIQTNFADKDSKKYNSFEYMRHRSCKNMWYVTAKSFSKIFRKNKYTYTIRKITSSVKLNNSTRQNLKKTV